MSTAEDIKKFVEDQDKKTGRVALNGRLEDSYDLLRMEPFKFPDVDSKPVTDYKIMTTNKPRVFADKLVSELAFGTMKRSIPIYKETKKERTDESMTEETAYGLIAMADDREMSFSRPPTQSQQADDAVVRGWIVPRVCVYEEDGKLVVDIAEWDIRTVYWLTGSKGLSRICNVRYTTKAEVDDLYGVDVTEEGWGGVTVYDNWTNEVEEVAVGDKIVYKVKRKLGRIPALIHPVGSSRQRYSSRHNDTLKDVGEDFAARIRDVAKRMSEIMSYYLTIVSQGAHPNLIHSFRGSPADFKKSPYDSGSIVLLDKNKEQEIAPMFKWTMPQDALTLANMVGDMLSDGTGPDVMYGRLAQAATAQGTAMLIHAAMGAMKNGQRAMEQVDSWVCGEVVRQFKEGKFKETNLQGVDGKQKQFNVTPDRKNLVTDRRFVSSLAIDSPQDILQNVGAAAQLVSSELISMQTARDKFLGQYVPDPDGEQNVIDREKVSKIVGVPEAKFLADLMEDPKGNIVAIMRLKTLLDQQIQQALQWQMQLQQPSGGENVSGVPKGMTPATRPNASMENTRLNRMGLERGR